MDPARYDAFFLWAGVTPSPVLDKARTIYILDGEVRARGPLVFTPLRPQAPRIDHADIWLTIRLERLDWDAPMHRRMLDEIARWQASGTRVAGLTLDFDTQTRGLANYAQFLRKVRAHLPPQYRLSVTGLMDWSVNADPAALDDLAGVVDEVIVQTYQGRKTIPGYQAYIARLGTLPLPFRVALVEDGEWHVPEQLHAMPNFRGYVVFLLPGRGSTAKDRPAARPS